MSDPDRGGQILVVDDEVDDEYSGAALLGEILRGEGYAVVSAVSFADMQSVLEEDGVDLILLDIDMPGTDGLQALAWLKSVWPDVGVIMATGRDDVGGVIEAMRRGAYDYLLKPFDVELVRSSIGRAMERQSLRAQQRSSRLELEDRARQLQQANRTLRESQARLIQSERLAYLGQLAAGIAHEINNPLGSVMSNLESLTAYSRIVGRAIALYEELADSVRDVSQSQEQGRALGAIAELRQSEDLSHILVDTDAALAESASGAKRIRDIVRAMGGFAGIDGSGMRMTDINTCLETTLSMLPSSLTDSCDMEVKAGDIPSIRCDPAKLNQLFMNLLENAIQAAGPGGRVGVETWGTGDNIGIRIVDDGPGVDPAIEKDLFTPFLTTKPTGEGVGLGLYAAYLVAQEHGGSIEVDSRPGQGTTVTVMLPVTGSRAGQPSNAVVSPVPELKPVPSALR